MNSATEQLLRAAVRAPSGDNTQPWRFEVEADAGRVFFYVDETRDPSPMNAGQRMARIAVGAALENLLRTATRNGWEAVCEEPTGTALAVVRVTPSSDGTPEVEKCVVERVTNRRVYDGRPVADDVLTRVRDEALPLDGVTAHWIVDRERIVRLAELIGRADAIMFGEPSMRRAFLSKVRFDAPPNAEVEEGLPLASLELSSADRVALKLMLRLPNWLFHLVGAPRQMAANARHLVESAAGLCLVVAPDRERATDVTVGRVMQRAWLALTGQGLAVQPMMSLAVLENVRENGREETASAVGRERLAELHDRVQALVPGGDRGRLAFLLRFGYAPTPSGRAGRRPPRQVVRSASPGPAVPYTGSARGAV